VAGAVEKIALVAGDTGLPDAVAQSLDAAGADFMVFPIRGHAGPEMMNRGKDNVFRIGNAAATLRKMKRLGITQIVMAGGLRRPTLREIWPSLGTLRIMIVIGLKALRLGDDGLLSGIAQYLEKQGMAVRGIAQVAPQLITVRGEYGKYGWEKYMDDIKRGFAVAKELGRLDVGQSVVVQQGLVLGLEGIEGTDSLIKRCGGLRRKGPGPVLVKTCKPGQDRRIDLPTIGATTVLNARDAGFAGIAIEAGAAIMVDFGQMVASADKYGLFIVGVTDEDL